ncbi:MAG: metallophosphoesterase [Oscillospiraceae bacterium]|jgi:3',5'-cyclic AMP phosphodiesterase CpdA|nr:metallophosphoesterase [Oscillospiraceae bacterium]
MPAQPSTPTLKLWQFTDTHLFFRNPMPSLSPHTDQKTILESGAIIDAALEEFLAEPDCDILLISGDLSCNGHAEEHRALIQKLRLVQAAGKRVIVITATHDYAPNKPEDRNDPGVQPLQRPDGKVFRHELRGLYDEFGFSDAIAYYEQDDGMSYVAQLAPGYRLLCLNDDCDGDGFSGFGQAQMQWIAAQLRLAREAGETVFAMTHHPSLPPSPIYPLIGKHDMMSNWQETSRSLADAGLRCLFTGHTHMHNIAKITTPAGNDYYEVNTSSLVGYPGAWRVLALTGSRLSVTTRYLKDFAWDKGGLTTREYLRKYFDFLLRDLFESAAERDFERLAGHAGGFSTSRETIMKLRIPIAIFGGIFNKITLGGLGTLTFCRGRVPKSVRKIRMKELILELVRNVFAGEEHYGPETPVGQALLAVVGRVNFLTKKKLAGTPVGDLREFVSSLIYDPTPDDRVEIDL